MTADEDALRSARERRLQRLRFWRQSCADASPDIQAHNMPGTSRPLIFFHGDFAAGGSHMRRLAGMVARPVIGIAPLGLHGGEIPPTIEAMAAERLPLVLSACPSGPYRVGGYCNGAAIAYETARLLARNGHEVEAVILVEPPSLSVRRGFRPAHLALRALVALTTRDPLLSTARVGRPMRLILSLTRMASLGPSGSLAWARHALGIRVSRYRRRRENAVARGGLSEREILDRQERLTERYANALHAWVPPPTSLPVIALSSGKDVGARACASFDATSWGRVCRDFRHIRLPGDHHSCMWDTAETLAGHLSDLMDGIRPPVPSARPAPEPPANLDAPAHPMPT